jgi:hypothetical protein
LLSTGCIFIHLLSICHGCLQVLSGNLRAIQIALIHKAFTGQPSSLEAALRAAGVPVSAAARATEAGAAGGTFAAAGCSSAAGADALAARDAVGAASVLPGSMLAEDGSGGAGGRSVDSKHGSDKATAYAACPDVLLRGVLRLMQRTIDGYEVHCAAQAERKRQAAQVQRANAGL